MISCLGQTQTSSMKEIRPITKGDFNYIWPLFKEIVQAGETYAYDPDTSKEQGYNLWVKTPLASYVGLIDQKIKGSYYLKANQPSLGSHVCNAGYMVSKEARGQGLGRAMCLHSQTEAKRLGFKAMQFNLVVSTNPAVGLWQDLGFGIVGTLPKAFKHKRLGLVDAFVMYKLLV